jgi:hypothetical protein
VLTIYLLASAIGGIIGGGLSALGGIASAAVAAKQAAKPIAEAAGVSPEMLQQQARAYLLSTNPYPTQISPHEAQKD